MKSACVGVLSIIELKNARWNIGKKKGFVVFLCILSFALLESNWKIH